MSIISAWGGGGRRITVSLGSFWTIQCVPVQSGFCILSKQMNKQTNKQPKITKENSWQAGCGAHICNPRTQGEDSGGLSVTCQPRLPIKFQASPEHRNTLSQKQNKSTKPTTTRNSYQKKLLVSQYVRRAKKPGARQEIQRVCSLSSAQVGKMGYGAPNQRGSAFSTLERLHTRTAGSHTPHCACFYRSYLPTAK